MDYALIIYTCTYNHMCIIPETQMTHILEDLTYKMGQVNPPKKEVSWVHPWKLTWNLKMGPLEEEIPALETIIFRFHGNLQGCILPPPKEWGDVFLTYQFPVILMSFLRWQAPLGWGSPRWVERKSPAKHALNKSAHTIHGIFTYIWLIFMVYVYKYKYHTWMVLAGLGIMM